MCAIKNEQSPNRKNISLALLNNNNVSPTIENTNAAIKHFLAEETKALVAIMKYINRVVTRSGFVIY
jgi:hypothetical protein